MNALSLWQPWATLMALGCKKIETRSWYCHYRGPLVIAATKTWNREVLELLTLSLKPPICDDDSDWRMIVEALVRGGYTTFGELPLGAALCTVEVVDCERTQQIAPRLSEEELAFGDYRPGRWAIITENCKRFPEPIPCRGAQGFWEFPQTTQAKERNKQQELFRTKVRE